jgi:hypothetical protein
VKVRPWDKTHPSNWQFDSPEIRIRVLEQRLELVETVLREKFGDEILTARPPVSSTAAPRKPGPDPTVPQEHLFSRREFIIDFFEFYWPEMRIAFAKMRRGPIASVLSELAERGGSYASTADKMLINVDQLVEFLGTREWNGDPRIAASAMAGVPEIRWTTWLRCCRGMKSERAIGPRALRDYLSRNFPSTFR